MDFTIPEHLTNLKERVREFREKELQPLEHDFLMQGKLAAEKRLALRAKARDEYDLWALDVPEKYGGADVGRLGMCLVSEELYKNPMMFDFGGSPEPALYLCNDEQKERYFYPIVNGEKNACYAFTEPDTGSDLGNIKTVAVQHGDSWVINGQKKFIGYLDESDFVILFTSTDPDKGARGITCFLVDKGTPGFEITRRIPTMGDEWEPFELTFTDCAVPDENRLGEINEGFKIADEQLTHGRLKIAAYQLGMAQRSLELAVDWAKQRTTWGKPIASRQAIQWMVADSEVELQAARLLVHQAAWLEENEKPIRNEAFIAKLYATEMAHRVTDRCIQIFGGRGFTREVPVQSFYRQNRVWRIGHGTSEIHRWMIARNILGPAADD